MCVPRQNKRDFLKEWQNLPLSIWVTTETDGGILDILNFSCYRIIEIDYRNNFGIRSVKCKADPS